MAAETPTIVLVHGAWADATGFDAEIRALRDRGYSAIGFGNPLRDLAGDAAYLAEFLRTLTGPIVLVGHSYGGNVISTAAIGNEQVQALVYFNGWMCDVGESQQQLLERFAGSLVGPSIRPVPFTNPDGSEGTDLYLAPEAFREAFAADVDPETAAVMAAAQRPYAAAAFAATPSAPPAWNALPCWYLLGTEDKAIPPELQRFMAERANAAIVEVPASHVSFVSQPERDLRRLQTGERKRIADALWLLAAGAENLDVKALKGATPWLRPRLGNYRVLHIVVPYSPARSALVVSGGDLRGADPLGQHPLRVLGDVIGEGLPASGERGRRPIGRVPLLAALGGGDGSSSASLSTYSRCPIAPPAQRRPP